MKTIDEIVTDLKNIGFGNLHPSVPPRDVKILKNISSLMLTNSYITESQGNLLIKILKENLEYIDTPLLEIASNLKTPSWKHNFRVSEKIRKICIVKRDLGDFIIKIEYNFDKEIKKAISFLNKTIGGDGFSGGLKYQNYALTEKNLVTIYDCLVPLKFTFSSDFLDLYKKIKNINLKEFEEKFYFDNFFDTKKQVILDKENFENDLIKLDRRLRYQYIFSGNFDEILRSSLDYKIANRLTSKVYLNQFKTNFSDLIGCLHRLKRDKILLVFDDYKGTDCVYFLNLIKDFVNRNNYNNHTGIYFRFDNKNDGITFNKLIAENKLNCVLDNNTKFAGISNGKLPKFLLKNDWYPDAVISFTNSLRSNRTEVYCNDCDLIVYYTPVKPLSIKCDEIL
jgi:hypothetical protein